MNGLLYSPVAINTHSPIDLLITMLGTNDLKADVERSPADIADGITNLVSVAKNCGALITHVLVIAPPHVVETPDSSILYQFRGGNEKSKELAPSYAEVAQKHSCDFLDGATIAASSPVDGIHLDASYHKHFAVGLTPKIQRILGLTC